MKNKPNFETVADVVEYIGKERMASVLAVSVGQVNRAIRENRMSASWSAFCKKDTGVELSDSLFYFKGLSTE